jgi:hypothetical protein
MQILPQKLAGRRRWRIIKLTEAREITPCK